MDYSAITDSVTEALEEAGYQIEITESSDVNVVSEMEFSVSREGFTFNGYFQIISNLNGTEYFGVKAAFLPSVEFNNTVESVKNLHYLVNRLNKETLIDSGFMAYADLDDDDIAIIVIARHYLYSQTITSSEDLCRLSTFLDLMDGVIRLVAERMSE